MLPCNEPYWAPWGVQKRRECVLAVHKWREGSRGVLNILVCRTERGRPVLLRRGTMIWPQMTTRVCTENRRGGGGRRHSRCRKAWGNPRHSEDVRTLRTAGIQVYHNRSLQPGDPGGKTEMHAGAGCRGLVGRETEQVPEQVRQERAGSTGGQRGRDWREGLEGRRGLTAAAGQVRRGPNHRDLGKFNEVYDKQMLLGRRYQRLQQTYHLQKEKGGRVS